MTIVSIFRGGGFGNLAGWYSYFFGTIIRHTRVTGFVFDQVIVLFKKAIVKRMTTGIWDVLEIAAF